MRVIQMLPSLSYGDAVGNDVMALDNALRGAGYETGIYAENIGARVPQGRAHRISKLPRLKLQRWSQTPGQRLRSLTSRLKRKLRR